MNERTNDDMTPDQARAALEQADNTDLDNPRDRRVHGWATIAFGVLVAVFTGLTHWLDDQSFRGDLPVLAIYVASLMAIAWWQTRLSRTWPPGTKRLSSIGVGSSVVVAFIGNMLLNYLRQDGPVNAGAVLGLVIAVALPSVTTGLTIMRGRR